MHVTDHSGAAGKSLYDNVDRLMASQEHTQPMLSRDVKSNRQGKTATSHFKKPS